MNRALYWELIAGVVIVTVALGHLYRRLSEIDLLLDGHLIDHDTTPIPFQPRKGEHNGP